MKLYSLTVLYKGVDGQVKKLCSASDLASFGYFQRSRLAAVTILFALLLMCVCVFMCVFLLFHVHCSISALIARLIFLLMC